MSMRFDELADVGRCNDGDSWQPNGKVIISSHTHTIGEQTFLFLITKQTSTASSS